MLWRLPLSCRSTWTPLVVTMGEDRGNKIMRGRNVRGAIIAVFLLGVLVFASVYYAWTTVIDIFQPVSLPGAGLVRFNQQDFLKYTKHPGQFPDAAKYPVLKLIPSGNSMEGLLFPATYDMPINANAQDVVNRMLTAFDGYAQKYDLVARARANKLNEYQMVMLASLVQREILNLHDAPGVAGVY